MVKVELVDGIVNIDGEKINNVEGRQELLDKYDSVREEIKELKRVEMGLYNNQSILEGNLHQLLSSYNYLVEERKGLAKEIDKKTNSLHNVTGVPRYYLGKYSLYNANKLEINNKEEL